jgi:hypothetical protein
MSEQTTYYGFKKPHKDDFYNVEDYNNNLDVIDSGLNTINENLQNKVAKVIGKGLSTNDYTNEEKAKLANLSGKGAFIGANSPEDTGLLWVDTTSGGVMKFYNGTAWVSTKAVWG